MNKKLALFGGKPIRPGPIAFLVPGGTMIGEEEKKGVLEVIKSKSLFRYPGYVPGFLGKVSAFEKEFAEKMGSKYALAVTSGTAALRVGLAAMGIGPGDEVILPAWTFVASAGAIVINRAIPVYAEIDRTLNLDPNDFEKKITKRTKAVMIVPVSGVCGRMEEIIKISKSHNLKVIEDCASSCGASYHGKMLGTFGDVGTFSLQMAKTITSGDGGVIITNSKDVYIRAVRYHDQGSFREHPDWGEPFIGENYRMNELTGAVALAQLRKLDKIIAMMKKVKKRIKDELRKYEEIAFREVLDEEGDSGVSLCLFFETQKKVERFIKAMQAENVGGVGSTRSVLYLQWPYLRKKKTVTPEGCPFTCPYYKGKAEYSSKMCPKTEELINRGAMISISPIYTQKEIEEIMLGIHKVMNYALSGKN